MPPTAAARVHPTAVVSPEAFLGDGVEIGAYAVLEGPVTLGEGCVVRPGAFLYGPLTMGPYNVVHTGAILGDQPQHLKYKGEPTSVEIGAGNVFREQVTVHRGTTHRMKTVIGDHNVFLAGSHVAHDCVVGNRCTFTSGCMIGGHCVIEDGVTIAENSAVHQFVRIGRLALLGEVSVTTKDMPPFVTQHGIDTITGVNVEGMKAAGMTPEQIEAVGDAFEILFRQGLLLPAAILEVERALGAVDVVREMLQFLRACRSGVNFCRLTESGRKAALRVVRPDAATSAGS